MVASHDPYLVALSVLISILAAYAARDLSERVRGARGWIWLAWLLGGAVASGICIWSMHFTAMQAFSLPGIPVLYDWPTVLLSLLVAMIGSVAALLVMSPRELGWRQVLAASILMGAVAISGMHYIGMAAMRMPGVQHHDHALMALAVVLAIVISFMALSLMFLIKDDAVGRRLRKQGSAVLMGTANPVMHYTAMAGLTVTFLDVSPDVSHALSITAPGVFGIGVVPVMVLIVALLTSLVDRLHRQNVLLDEAQRVVRVGSWSLDVATNTVRWSQELYRIFDVDEAAFAGTYETFLSRIHPDDCSRVLQVNAAARSRGEPFETEYRILTRSGQVKHIREIGYARRDRRGHVSALFGTAQDVTERKRAEEALHETAERLQILSRRLLDVQENERRHLARELHDQIGQLLTALQLLLKPEGDSTAAVDRGRFEQARGIVDELLTRVRALSFDLRPLALDQFGLLPALSALFERHAQLTGLRVSFNHQGLEGRLAAEVETTAYRIVQEALTNAVRHAGVQTVSVRIWVQEGSLHVQVEDEGAGFDPAAALAAGTTAGLAGMRERVQLLGGQMTINSAPGEGTQLLARLPLGP